MNNQDEKAGFFGTLGKSNWYHVGLSAIFGASILLLFVDKLPKPLAENLLPALIVFGIGSTLLGYIEGTIFRKNFSKDGDEKTKHPYGLFFTLSILWFIGFIAYLFWRKVL